MQIRITTEHFNFTISILAVWLSLGRTAIEEQFRGNETTPYFYSSHVWACAPVKLVC